MGAGSRRRRGNVFPDVLAQRRVIAHRRDEDETDGGAGDFGFPDDGFQDGRREEADFDECGDFGALLDRTVESERGEMGRVDNGDVGCEFWPRTHMVTDCATQFICFARGTEGEGEGGIHGVSHDDFDRMGRMGGGG